MSLSSEIFEYIKANKGASFVEIERIFERHKLDYKGDLAMTSEHHENLVFWVGWNKEAIDILKEVLSNKLIVPEATHPITYISDGKRLNMPIANRYQKYAKPRWFPIAYTVSK